MSRHNYVLHFLIIFSLVIISANSLFASKRKFLLDPPDNAVLRIDANVSTKWIEQHLDHFDPTDTRTWQQRYHVNEINFNENSRSRVFLMIGGEAEANAKWANYGSWIDLAEKYGALVFYVEHRFYGESHPFENLTTENLRYLTTHQALEDLATFITAMNEEYVLADDVKWIAFGGSYAGSMAAWMRQKYPHLVAGAMSASGPVKAVLSFDEYLQVVLDDLATYSDTCLDKLKTAYVQLDELVSSCLEDVEIYQNINSMFNLCDSIEESDAQEKDLTNLFEVLTDNNFAAIAQYNKNYGSGNVTTETLCEILEDDGVGTELERLAKINSLILQRTGEQCLDYKYDKMVQGLQNVTADKDKMMRQWIYQTCTEYGFFQTSNQSSGVFGSRIDTSFFTDLCTDIFGTEFNETLVTLGIDDTNIRYGSQNIEVSNVVFVHGTFDPWHVLGVLKVSNYSGSSAILIDGAAHCSNMYPALENDTDALTNARTEIERLVGVWVGVHNDDDDDSAATAITSSVILGLGVLLALLFEVMY